jgi:GNAT superfamily N-acetyltransferase
MADKTWCARLSEQKLSYDLRLFRPAPGESPELASRRNGESFPSGPPDPQKEGLKRKIAETLVAQNPQLSSRQFPFRQIAHFERISEDAARRKYRHLELNSSEGGNGLQIFLRDDEALLSVPFWHEGNRAAEVFQQVWKCVEIIRTATGYLCFDPQLGRLIEAPAGCEEALSRYLELVRRSREAPTDTGPVETSEPLPARICQLTVSEDREIVLVAVGESGGAWGFAHVAVGSNGTNGSTQDRVASLTAWYVIPECRGRGIGRQLRERAEQWATRQGLQGLTLHGANETHEAEAVAQSH